MYSSKNDTSTGLAEHEFIDRSVSTMPFFLLPPQHRTRVICVLLNAAKVERDNNVVSGGDCVRVMADEPFLIRVLGCQRGRSQCLFLCISGAF